MLHSQSASVRLRRLHLVGGRRAAQTLWLSQLRWLSSGLLWVLVIASLLEIAFHSASIQQHHDAASCVSIQDSTTMLPHEVAKVLHQECIGPRQGWSGWNRRTGRNLRYGCDPSPLAWGQLVLVPRLLARAFVARSSVALASDVRALAGGCTMQCAYSRGHKK